MRAHNAASTVSFFLIGFLCGTWEARAALDTMRRHSTQRGGLTCVAVRLVFVCRYKVHGVNRKAIRTMHCKYTNRCPSVFSSSLVLYVQYSNSTTPMHTLLSSHTATSRFFHPRMPSVDAYYMLQSRLCDRENCCGSDCFQCCA